MVRHHCRGVSGGHCLVDFRGPKTPLTLTLQLLSSNRIWFRVVGSMGASPMLLPVNWTARTASVPKNCECVFTPSTALRASVLACFNCIHHRLLLPVLSIKMCSGSVNPRSYMPNSIFSDRQVWMAASLNCCCPARLSFAGIFQTTSGSNQTDSVLRCFEVSS